MIAKDRAGRPLPFDTMYSVGAPAPVGQDGGNLARPPAGFNQLVD
jgi:hypothetical protein